MVTAGELKARARAKLAEKNGWFIAFCANLLSIVIINSVNFEVRGFLGLTSLMELAQKVREGSAAPGELAQMLQHNRLELFVATLIALYLSSVFTFGMSSLSVAVIRGGAKVGHVFSGFGRSISLLWMLLAMQINVALRLLLFIVPGIRALFSYALMYFVRVDHPDWGAKQCLAESKRLMEGNRWRLFCLLLSFLGWFLLGVVTFGIAFFVVMPYLNVSLAAFYEDLLDHDIKQAE